MIAKHLRENFPSYEVGRSFFVGHVLFELCLDRLLMEKDSNLCDSFYSHFHKHTPEEIAQITETLAGCELPGYSDFLVRFIEHPYIPRYKKPEYIIRVLRRILAMVRIAPHEFAYLDDTDFEHQLLKCEASLQLRYEAGLESIKAVLKPM